MPRNNPVCLSGFENCQHFCEFNSPGFFCGFGLLERGDNFKFFFGGILLQLYELRFNTQDLSVIFFSRFASVKYIFHSFLGFMIKKFSSPKMQNRQFFFTPKIQYKLVAERSEANLSNLRIPFWCSILKLVRTHFDAAGGEEVPSRKFGKAAEPHRSKPQKNPEKNIGSNHILILGEENFLIQSLCQENILNLYPQFIFSWLKTEKYCCCADLIRDTKTEIIA